MPELEGMLTRLGRELDWPETPDLAGGVRARLAAAETAEPDRRVAPATRRRPLFRRSVILAFAILLVAAGTVFAAVPSVRDAVLEFFGLQGATVERREVLPTPPPDVPLRFGTRMTLEDARARVGFEPLIPADPGDPDAVYVRSDVPGGELGLAYRARPGLPRASTTRLGLVVSQFRGDLAPEYVGKVVGPDAGVEELTVGGERALWIEGAPHFFFYRGPDGEIIDGELRVAQNVLLVERGRLLVRLEGAFGRERALEIAESLG